MGITGQGATVHAGHFPGRHQKGMSQTIPAGGWNTGGDTAGAAIRIFERTSPVHVQKLSNAQTGSCRQPSLSFPSLRTCTCPSDPLPATAGTHGPHGGAVRDFRRRRCGRWRDGDGKGAGAGGLGGRVCRRGMGAEDQRSRHVPAAHFGYRHKLRQRPAKKITEESGTGRI